MDASFDRRSILTPAKLRDLAQRSDAYGWAQTLSHFGAIALTGLLMSQVWDSWLIIPVFIIHGILINFLYAGQHELSHGTVFQWKPANEWVGRVIGFIVIFPRDFDQIQHFAHHRHTSDWEKDGELAREPYTLRSYLLWILGFTYWISRFARVIRLARGVVVEPYIRPDQHAKVIFESRVHLALYLALAAGSIWAGSWALVAYWLAPMLATKLVHQMQNTIEHLGLEHSNDILTNTRSTQTNALMRWMCWQMQYHTAHHMFPSVPFWKLKSLNAELEGAIGGPPQRMRYLSFQFAIIRALMGGKSEGDYPMNEVWILPRPGGGEMRLPAE